MNTLDDLLEEVQDLKKEIVELKDAQRKNMLEINEDRILIKQLIEMIGKIVGVMERRS